MAAAQAIRAACPSQANLTAPGRLAVMQQRIEAMITAAGTIQPKLENFYGLLDDEQKARLNALSQDQRKTAGPDTGPATTGPAAQGCGGTPPVALEWPSSEIEARVHPDDTQRAKLKALQDTSARAADALKAGCQTSSALTPPARLAASAKRLETMLQAVKEVRAALEDFYATLNDEQKAQFEGIGPKRSA
jgi:LTXXQ motif family protein